jgi:phosphonate transport system ATP-binding protein
MELDATMPRYWASRLAGSATSLPISALERLRASVRRAAHSGDCSARDCSASVTMGSREKAGEPAIADMRTLAHSDLAEPALTIDGLDVDRHGRRILDRISLAVEPGRVTAIVGPSGAGKTTLINVINGLVAPTRGRICAADIGALDDAEKWARMRRRTATIFQDHALIGRLGAFDNVLLGLAAERNPFSPLPWGPEARARAAHSLRDVGMLSRAFDRVENLSGGEKQRIGIARALSRRPRLLLGDEPFSSLDLPLARQIGADLRVLAERDGVTVVLVLHQLSLARAFADRIVAVKSGRIAFDGPSVTFDQEAEAMAFAPDDRSTKRSYERTKR